MKQRQLALQILYKTIKDESYSNLLMRKELNQVPVIQRGFITNLVNAVLRKYEFLHYQIEQEVRKDTSLRLKLILMMAIYEKFFLKEKDYVVNHEYVDLGKNSYEKSFINALLRNITELKDSDQDYVNACLPEWIYRLLSSQYEKDDLEQILSIYQKIPSITYRINKKKCSFSDLNHLDIMILDDDCFQSRNNLLHSQEYSKGYFYIQDFNSASLYRHLDLHEDNKFLDVCCAPGSKLFNCLDILKEENCYANDIHANRVELIRKMAEKLGYYRIRYLNCDGRLLKNNVPVKFDRILLDAPCSGLGVLARKPDLKFHIKPESLDELQKLQLQLLESMDDIIDKDGILLYSTCTLNRKENDRMVKTFLKENNNFVLLEDHTILNPYGDCFYYAKMRRK